MFKGEDMNLSTGPAVLFLLCLCVLPSYSQESVADLRPLLQDASYVMNRFDEIATRLDVEINGWTVDVATKKVFHQELAATLRNSNVEKVRLAALLTRPNISNTDLFDVYSNLGAVASELDGQASNAANWGSSQARSIELAQLGSKALTLAANVGVALRSKIAAQEAELAACMTRAHNVQR
jgi:hypothetical protein